MENQNEFIVKKDNKNIDYYEIVNDMKAYIEVLVFFITQPLTFSNTLFLTVLNCLETQDRLKKDIQVFIAIDDKTIRMFRRDRKNPTLVFKQEYQIKLAKNEEITYLSKVVKIKEGLKVAVAMTNFGNAFVINYFKNPIIKRFDRTDQYFVVQNIKEPIFENNILNNVVSSVQKLIAHQPRIYQFSFVYVNQSEQIIEGNRINRNEETNFFIFNELRIKSILANLNKVREEPESPLECKTIW